MLSLAGVSGLAIVLYILGYRFYGAFLSKAFGVSNAIATPAVLRNDGEDFVPTRPSMLLGQHFSAIAAVGPIAGPILAGAQYGWAMGLVWVVFGAIFIGATHDFAALLASVRHGARSIGEVMRDHLGRGPAILFSSFIWFSLIYVIVVFTDLTSSAFVNRPDLGIENYGPGVATSSLLYLGIGVLMGIALTKLKWRLSVASAVFIPAIFVSIWLGQKIPIVFAGDPSRQQRVWDLIILAYCFVASVAPMWILLQPRGYLGGIILYTTFAVGLAGVFFGHAPTAFPAFRHTLGAGGQPLPLFPLLFTTIACGACSGFHGLVASGTTSKQLARESDARIVGFGGMLLESFVAVVAMATLMIVSPGDKVLSLGPDEIYARGLAHFMGVFNIPFAAAVSFGKLAFATFIYDTLDVSTRLGRYVIEEIFGVKGRRSAFVATASTVAVPALCVFATFHDAAGNAVPLWKIVWPAFGASNQLLAALTLMSVSVWLRREGRPWLVTGLPGAFMTVVSLASLVDLVRTRLTASGGSVADPVAATAAILIALGLAYLGFVVPKLIGTNAAAPTAA